MLGKSRVVVVIIRSQNLIKGRFAIWKLRNPFFTKLHRFLPRCSPPLKIWEMSQVFPKEDIKICLLHTFLCPKSRYRVRTQAISSRSSSRVNSPLSLFPLLHYAPCGTY